MDNIDHSHPLMTEGRALRDRLAITGEDDQLKRKLDHIVDLKSCNSALAQKLKNLLALVKVAPVKKGPKK